MNNVRYVPTTTTVNLLVSLHLQRSGSMAPGTNTDASMYAVQVTVCVPDGIIISAILSLIAVSVDISVESRYHL